MVDLGGAVSQKYRDKSRGKVRTRMCDEKGWMGNNRRGKSVDLNTFSKTNIKSVCSCIRFQMSQILCQTLCNYHMNSHAKHLNHRTYSKTKNSVIARENRMNPLSILSKNLFYPRDFFLFRLDVVVFQIRFTFYLYTLHGF